MKEISAEDLLTITKAKHKMELTILVAEKYKLAASLAESNYRNVVNNIYVKYGLPTNYIIDDNTGAIVVPEETAPEEEVKVETENENE